MPERVTLSCPVCCLAEPDDDCVGHDVVQHGEGVLDNRSVCWRFDAREGVYVVVEPCEHVVACHGQIYYPPMIKHG